MPNHITRFDFNKITDTSTILPLKEEWRKTLTGPQDDMWEAFTEYADHWALKEEDETIGYACVNEENLLLQFFVLSPEIQHGITVFQQFLQQQNINKALIGTNNPACLSLAMHFQKKLEVHTYLFTDFLHVTPVEKEGILRSAGSTDLEKVVDFCHISMGGPKEWLTGYLGNLIAKEALFMFEDGAEILGTCEVRKSENNPAVANIGMVVSATHRRKSLGTFLLGKAKGIAIQQGKQPICSCEKDNIGSLKSIERNGFRSLHQMLSIEF